MSHSAHPVIGNTIINKIYLSGDLKFMLEFDLAELHLIETKQF